MNHNLFKVIMTGRYKKSFDIQIAAEKIANNSSITPTKALKIIKSEQEITLHEEMDHKNAYQLKRLLQNSGIEVKLEPAKFYRAPTQEVSIDEPKKKKFRLRSLLPFKRKKKQISATQTKPKKKFSFRKKPTKVEQPIKIDWEEQSRYRKITHTPQKKGTVFGNFIYLSIFAGIFWVAYNGNFSLFGTADAFDDDGNPIVVLLVKNNCPGCVTIREQLKFRHTPFESINLDSIDKESQEYKTWGSAAQKGVPLLLVGKDKLLGGTQSQVAITLAENFGSKYFTTTEKPLYAKHFNRDGSKAIVVYGAPWCGACKSLKKKLNNAGVPYNYTDVDTNTAAKEALGIRGYPTVWFGYKQVRSSFQNVQALYNKS